MRWRTCQPLICRAEPDGAAPTSPRSQISALFTPFRDETRASRRQTIITIRFAFITPTVCCDLMRAHTARVRDDGMIWSPMVGSDHAVALWVL
mmetsp:Transcript_51578/g.149912  ORF Transcript_51578/g.149912 Transcript_51578/m.149912 type:complete len:93 (-) Transcript_51578:108-386(-)